MDAAVRYLSCEPLLGPLNALAGSSPAELRVIDITDHPDQGKARILL